MRANDDAQKAADTDTQAAETDTQQASESAVPPMITGESRGGNLGRGGDVLVRNDIVSGDPGTGNDSGKKPLPEPQNSRGWSEREESTLYDVEPSTDDDESESEMTTNDRDFRKRQIEAAIEGLKADSSKL
jgi:hypothetical protein